MIPAAEILKQNNPPGPIPLQYRDIRAAIISSANHPARPDEMRK
jgi:hypothetical protein